MCSVEIPRQFVHKRFALPPSLGSYGGTGHNPGLISGTPSETSAKDVFGEDAMVI